MKRVVVVLMCLGVLVVTSGMAQQAAPVQAAAAPVEGPSLRIAFINSRQILTQTPGYASAESTFNRELQGYRDEVQKLQKQLDSSVQAFDQQSIALSPAAKQQRQKDLQNMQQRLEQRSGELQQKAQQREQELLQPIQQRINAVIQGIRAEGNYSMIFDADTPGSNIVAADQSLDITSRVLERLRRSQ
ncbi:MAG TPA: OmpH family outer membrane protein [Gemmatimonadales bacterium]|nr:OmpH family outer membrane protein [Gemmatimonadales bacterium]